LSGKKYYFFSDVHLGLKSAEEEKLKEKKLVDFLESIKDSCEKLFIVGDLFDCWIEYRKVVPKGYFRLLAKLNELSSSGIEINFFSGNHDFWLNTYLRDDVGMKLYYDQYTTELDGKKFLITHGDGLSKGDLGYKIIKKILRSRVNQFLYSLIHPDIGIWLAQGSSKRSRYQTAEKSHGVQGMYEFAAGKIETGYDYIIMGHFHKPQNVEVKRKDNTNGYFITLGDWIKHFSYGVYSEGKFELKSWEEG
jgi:UDP-2,3-diacylglucosamine hydrolase